MSVNGSELADFVVAEAELLDRARYNDWLRLFADDGRYWVPASFGQTDPIDQVSIIYEDVQLLRMRIGRFVHPFAHGMSRPIRTSRLVGSFKVESQSATQAVLASRFVISEWREESFRQFAGAYVHTLVQDGGWKIREKRVELLNPEEAFESIQILF